MLFTSKKISDFSILHTLYSMNLCHASKEAQHHLQPPCSWIIHVCRIQEQECLKCLAACWTSFSSSAKVTVRVADFVTVPITTFSCHLCVHHSLENIFISHINDVVSQGLPWMWPFATSEYQAESQPYANSFRWESCQHHSKAQASLARWIALN